MKYSQNDEEGVINLLKMYRYDRSVTEAEPVFPK